MPKKYINLIKYNSVASKTRKKMNFYKLLIKNRSVNCVLYKHLFVVSNFFLLLAVKLLS